MLRTRNTEPPTNTILHTLTSTNTLPVSTRASHIYPWIKHTTHPHFRQASHFYPMTYPHPKVTPTWRT